MLLSRIELRNFRCFKELDLELEPTTVLVGANDTGKSTVLEAIAWLLWDASTIDWSSSEFEPEPDGIEDDGTFVRRSWHGRQATSVVGSITDLGTQLEEDLGPTAPNGTLRLGISSDVGSGLWVVLEQDALPMLLERIDTRSMRERLGIRSKDSLPEALEDEGILADIDGRAWVDMSGVAGHADPPLATFEFLKWSTLSVIPIGGPLDTAWDPQTVIEPIVRDVVRRSVAGAFESRMGEASDGGRVAFSAIGEAISQLEGAIDDLMRVIGDAHTRALDADAPFSEIEWDASLDPVDVADLIAERLWAGVKRKERSTPGSLDIANLGPGSRRQLALQALRLYRDPVLWPSFDEDLATPSLAIVLLEEPENGLHPAAQRRLAESLRDWATFGLQLVVVTHSPAFVNAAEPAGIRLAHRSPSVPGELPSNDVTRPADLDEVRHELGVRPSDILLARRFVIVEGQTERAVFDIWARRLGVDLQSEGVQLVPLGGFGAAERVAQFVTLAYQGADFLVVMDAGPDTTRMKRDLDSVYSGRVETIVLSERDIEGFYHPDAVAAWLVANGADTGSLRADVRDTFERQPKRPRALGTLTQRYLGRRYKKVDDCAAIAHLTLEGQIHGEVKALLTRVVTRAR